MTQASRELLPRIRRHSAPLEALSTAVPARLTKFPGIRLIAFDIYGTLLISASGDVGSIASDTGGERFRSLIREELGLTFPEAVDPEMLFRRQVEKTHRKLRATGLPYPEVDTREIWRSILAEAGLEGRAEEYALLFELARNPVWPMPGSGDLLDSLAGRMVLGIVSNAQFYTPLMLEEHLPRGTDYFEAPLVIWSYELRRAKPDPELFRRLCASARESYGIEPGEILYVGNDMLNDVCAAKRAGLKAALFAGDRRSLRVRREDPRVEGIEADAVITHLNQLHKLLP